MGFFDKLKTHFSGVFAAGRLDDDFYDELEEALITADVGAGLADSLTSALRDRVKQQGIKEPEQAKEALRALLIDRLSTRDGGAIALSPAPAVILVVGVNGVGKTTTVGKLALRLKKSGKRVVLCAGDTFRAAAADQLEIWSNRAGVELVRQHEGADPAAVVFDALNAARARAAAAVLVDTAGRLHNKTNLMQELAKIGRVADRELPGRARECLLVLDATTGQNGLAQAVEFAKSVPLTGLIITKMDGTAKGGVALAVSGAMGVPVKLVGVGEKPEDLIDFNAPDFVREILP